MLPPPPPDCANVLIGSHIVLFNRKTRIVVESKPAAESILRRKHFAKTPCRAFCGGERTGSLPEEKSERGLYARKNI
jgi:hypothetical protein